MTVSKAGGGNGEHFTIKLSSSYFVQTSTGDMVKTGVFHLFGFRLFRISGQAVPIQLIYDKWIIDVDLLVESEDNSTETKRSGIETISHLGRITTSDGSCFSADELKDMLAALDRFFSFIMGHSCVAICPVGLSASGKQVYVEYNEPKHTGGVYSAFYHSTMQPEVVELFSSFMTVWDDSDLHDTLWDIFYYYMMANDSGRGIEPGTIIAQAALEKLCYSYMKRKMHLSDDQINFHCKGTKKVRKKPTQDKLREVLAKLNLPASIPATLPSLSAWATTRQQQQQADHPSWTVIADGPFVLTDMRNAYTHSESMSFNESAKISAWRLSLWYIEIIILRLANYAGNYSNRLNKCAVEKFQQVHP